MNKLIKVVFIFGFVLSLPITILCALFVWFEDGFPLIFVQKRLGINKKEFNLYKIRTMYKSAPNLGTHEVGNVYHLKIGTFIRKLKIDELPQLINYFIGDINLIGPRPGLVNQQELTLYREKYQVYDSRPGITGLAQVLGYDMSNPKLLAMIDNLYLEQKKTKLDIIIFLATFFSYYRRNLKERFKVNIDHFKEEINDV